MATTIALVQTKGGVGKTTSAIYLACALIVLGFTVELWDTDMQGSATEWAEDAQEAGTPLPFPVEIVNIAKLKRLAGKSTKDFVIIDTPPGDPATIDAAIRAADVVIMPTEPAVMDLRRLVATNSNLPSDKARIALFTKVNEQTVALRDSLEFLEDSDLALFSTRIKHRQAFKTIPGEIPTDLMGYEEVAKELMEALS
ncbi:ParA-family protein [Glutamicibacter arilaitensis Re117]|uniref:ParA-family protein n=1 Tax=Glutamicibacter arilaitensis (strain DSM 16368 / CIP 108037 / IAM 15318 / JCM 13566 / NCIMB 14258 / Re117) TaxID=861360 RepID=A0ABM9Q0K4_GLUAR|nr:ParA family protein [Glutamicibacter arilaitensis]CBT77232.1 ParA-family protein [Glutamicibacter arilaitensis Re117]